MILLSHRKPRALKGWDAIFDKWHESQHDDLKEWLEINYSVPEELKKCDLCGETFTGPHLPVYNESFVIQKGLISCTKHIKK